MINVHQWAEIRRLHFSEGLGIKTIVKRTGVARNTVRAAIRSQEPPAYCRPARSSKLDPFKGEIVSLLKDDDDIPGKRVLEILQGLGYAGGKSILNEHLAQVRPLFRKPRVYQRTLYLPGRIGQWDLWEPPFAIPVGYGHARRGYVLTGVLGYSKVGAGALVFSKSAPDLLWAMDRCLRRLGGVPRTAVFDREGALCADKTARDPRPTDPLAGFAGHFGFGVHFRPGADPEGKGVVERLHGYLETSFVPGRCFSDPEDFQMKLDRWFDEVANVRLHSTIRCRPIDRLPEDRAAMLPLPERSPDLTWRFHAPVHPDPYVRVDTNDYSVHPDAVGLVVEVRVTRYDITCVTKDGRVVAHHARSFAPHRTITAAEHGRAVRERREGQTGRAEPLVQIRDLGSYDRLLGLQTPEPPGPLVEAIRENGSQTLPEPGSLLEGGR